MWKESRKKTAYNGIVEMLYVEHGITESSKDYAWTDRENFWFGFLHQLVWPILILERSLFTLFECGCVCVVFHSYLALIFFTHIMADRQYAQFKTNALFNQATWLFLHTMRKRPSHFHRIVFTMNCIQFFFFVNKSDY